METLSQFFWPFVMAMIGVVAHILKRAQVNGEGFDALTGYVRGHTISIILTLIGCIASLGVAYQMGELGLFAGFSCGYLANSIFGKAEKKGLRTP